MAITSIYAGLCGILLLAVSIRVVVFRGKYEVGIGSDGHEDLQRAIRVQANFIEYVPLTLILLALAEAQAATGWTLHLAGAALVVGRGLHAAGFSRSSGRSFGRFVGTNLTWLSLLGLAIANVTVPWWSAPA